MFYDTNFEMVANAEEARTILNEREALPAEQRDLTEFEQRELVVATRRSAGPGGAAAVPQRTRGASRRTIASISPRLVHSCSPNAMTRSWSSAAS